jgi:hypothetical protein
MTSKAAALGSTVEGDNPMRAKTKLKVSKMNLSLWGKISTVTEVSQHGTYF